jgi:hypothetical protein
VKLVTVLPSLLLLLVFIVIVCNGSIEEMMVKNSSLTWFEEWVLYFEFVWGRTCIRGIDAEEKYGLVRSVIRDIIQQKLALVQRAVSSWPRYARHEEDFSLPQRNGSCIMETTAGKYLFLVLWLRIDLAMSVLLNG